MDNDATGSQPSLRQPTPEELDAAEKHLQLWAMYRRRGDQASARKELDEAKKIAPGGAEIILHDAEDLIERGQSPKALALLEEAVKLHVGHVALENLFAETLLKVKNPAADLMQMSDFEVMAQGKMAVWLSLIFPGLGQIVTGRVPLGAGFMTVFVAGWLVALAVPGGMQNLFAAMGLNRTGNATDVNGGVLIPLFFALAAHIGSLTEAASYAKRISPRVIKYPTPPVDKPF